MNSGRLEEIQSILEEEQERKKKLVLAKDEAGACLLHKAVYYDLGDIARWLAVNFPSAVGQKDAEGRTPYHYSPACKDVAGMQGLLRSCGADPSALDGRQKTARYYADKPAELELPSWHGSHAASRKAPANKEGESMGRLMRARPAFAVAVDVDEGGQVDFLPMNN